MSGGMIALLVILCIFASPFILGIGGGALGVILGLLGAFVGGNCVFCTWHCSIVRHTARRPVHDWCGDDMPGNRALLPVPYRRYMRNAASGIFPGYR